MTTITRGAALRIALAAKTLPDVDLGGFTVGLAERLGLPVTEAKLAAVTVADLKALLAAGAAAETDMDGAALKQAARCLWGEDEADADVPHPAPGLLDPAAAALRVAVASNSAENLDGHFGSCPRFLIYQVDREGTVLVDVRSTALADQADDRNAARAALVDDCQLLYVQSIGGPAAAKVVRAGVHPVRFAHGGPAREALRQLQAVLDAPPPWLARALGVAAPSLARLEAAQPA